ncbi:MAG: glucose-6-phosphate dehydrogenase [Bacilli bacterium]|nr:glucose-6-phosphate dehydrogenase [Bacilli bacterium]MBN2877891.1 glucose-6-phosphate dehydrogenase [Bacilli bacterium]
MKKSIVIFGSTGNLTYKKLLPAIDNLIRQKRLKKDDRVYLLARHDISLKQYIEDAKKQVKEMLDWTVLEEVLEFVYFHLNQIEDYQKLNHRLKDSGYTDNVFYLALPPKLFPEVAKGISASGLVTKGDASKRIVFEKPFGENLESARTINRELWRYFDESQIYRIDHYLGKEMIQNILVVRFANRIFGQTWNHNTIRNIVIIAKETEGVMSRGNYYDKIGALKDMLQSHLLQMAALIGMTRPKTFQSEDIKDAKVKVLNDLKLDSSSVVFGQYNGYLDENKIADDSQTETFIFAKAHFMNDKWRGTPIYFITGKKLDEKRSEIIINFKDDTNLNQIFSNAKPNNTKLVFKVAPEDGVKFQLNVKQPGLSDEIISGHLDYCHTCNWVGNTTEAYEKLLFDVLNNNKTLFTRWDEIEVMWEIISEIQHMNIPLHVYDDFDHLKEIILTEKGVDIDAL